MLRGVADSLVASLVTPPKPLGEDWSPYGKFSVEMPIIGLLALCGMTPLRGVLLIFMLKKVICLRKPPTRQKHWRTRNGCFIKGELFSLKKVIVVRQP